MWFGINEYFNRHKNISVSDCNKNSDVYDLSGFFLYNANLIHKSIPNKIRAQNKPIKLSNRENKWSGILIMKLGLLK